MTTRRAFIEGLAGAGLFALGGCSTVGEWIESRGRIARVGFVGNAVLSPKRDGRLRKALAYFRQAGVDAVVIVSWKNSGDAAACAQGLIAEWDDVFGGTATRRIEGPGVHDVNGFRFVVSERAFSSMRGLPVFHADGRRALTEDAFFHQPGSLGYYVGSLNGVTLPAGFYMGYADPDGPKGGAKGRGGKGRKGEVEEFTERLAKVSQGLLVDATQDGARIRRLDFTPAGPLDGREAKRLKRDGIVYAETLAADVVVGADERPGPPAFWPGTELVVVRGQVGYHPVVTLRWPTLLAFNSGVRVPFCEVTARPVGEPGRVVFRRYVPSVRYCLAERRDVAATKCTFRVDEIGADEVEWRVTPVSAAGVRGEPLTGR